jgi:hypothetical protein
MGITFDPDKRDWILQERGIDVADADGVFEGFHLTRRDTKHSGAEERFISVGLLGSDVVIAVWTYRGRRPSHRNDVESE